MVYNPFNKEIYIGGSCEYCQFKDAFILGISSESNKLVANITVKGVNLPLVESLASEPANGGVYFSLRVQVGINGIVGAINLGNKIASTKLMTSTDPSAIIYNPSNAYLYVAYPDNNTVAVISS